MQDTVVPRSPRLVLASGSVSRLRVLRDAGFDPVVVVSGVDEEFAGLTPTEAVVAIAERKALAVAERCQDSLVIGCDSMLELDGEALGKPASSDEVKENMEAFIRSTDHAAHRTLFDRHVDGPAPKSSGQFRGALRFPQ